MFQRKRVKFGSLVAGAQDVLQVLNAVPLNGAAGTRTVTLDCKGLDFIRLAYVFTRSAATALTFTPSLSFDAGASYCPLTAKSVSAGTATVTPYIDSRSVSGSENGTLDWYDVRGADKLQVVIAGASAGAGDLINVYAVGIALA